MESVGPHEHTPAAAHTPHTQYTVLSSYYYYSECCIAVMIPVSQICSSFERRLAEQKAKHEELIFQLKFQLKDLELYARQVIAELPLSPVAVLLYLG